MLPLLPTHRIVVFESELLGKRGNEYATAIVTWHDDYLPDRCWTWFDTYFNGERYAAMLCEIKNFPGPIHYGLLH
jgi:hypothetical protein